MKPGYHIAFSTVVAGVLFMITRSWATAAASLLSGIFVDLDHIYDVLREHGRPFSIEKMFRICYTCDFRKIVLPFHGWEWLLALFAAAWYTKWDPLLLGVLVGYSQHMVLDSLHNSPHFLAYSFLWRWKQGFDYDITFGARLPRKIGVACQKPSFTIKPSTDVMIKLVNILNKLY